MIDRHAALFHDLLEVAVAQRVGRIPADADQDHIDRKAHPLKLSISIRPRFGRRSLPDWPAGVCECDRTSPLRSSSVMGKAAYGPFFASLPLGDNWYYRRCFYACFGRGTRLTMIGRGRSSASFMNGASSIYNSLFYRLLSFDTWGHNEPAMTGRSHYHVSTYGRNRCGVFSFFSRSVRP